jgi:hypothetical protein
MISAQSTIRCCTAVMQVAHFVLVPVVWLVLGTSAATTLAQPKDERSNLEDHTNPEAAQPASETLAPVINSAEPQAERIKSEGEIERPKVYTFEFPTREMESQRLEQSRARINRLREIRAVTLDDYEAALGACRDIADQAASDVLKKQFDILGVSLATDPATEKLLEKRVTVRCNGCSQLELIERVCEQAGVYADYSSLGEANGGGLAQMMAFMFCPPSENDGKIQQDAKSGQPKLPEAKPAEHIVTLRPGSRPFPLKFVGPCCIEVSQLEENVSFASGSLNVRVYLTNLPTDLARRHELEKQLQVEFKPVVDQDGEVLAERFTSRRPWLESAAIQSQEHNWQLKSLLRKSTEIRVAGVVRISVPTRVSTVIVKGGERGASGESDGWRMELLEVKVADESFQRGNEDSARRHQVSFKLTGPPLVVNELLNKVFFVDEHGDKLDSIITSITDDRAGHKPDSPMAYRGDMVIEGKPAGAFVKLFSESHNVDYPFQLSAPLKSFAQQPSELQELQFEGASPVSIGVQEVLPEEFIPKVKLSVKNQSNKDIASASFNYIYLDEDGEELARFIGFVTGKSTFDGKPAVCVAAGQSIDEDSSAGFMPKQTAHVRIELTSVQFMDGTAWNAKRKSPVELRAAPSP